MKQLDVEKVYIDKISAKSADRPQLREMLSFVRNGDTVMVEAISRFAGNTKDLLELIDVLQKKGVEFISQKEKLIHPRLPERFIADGVCLRCRIGVWVFS